jgi:uncharacterized protein Yka (UPF0111/DUF47 family)
MVAQVIKLDYHRVLKKIGVDMSLRSAMEEAFHRGEKIKDQFLNDMMNSPTVNHFLQNELFLKSFTKLLNTKYELKRAFKTNFKTMLQVFNVPTRDEVNSMERKIHRIENEIDGIHRKILTARLSTSSLKNTLKKSPTSSKEKSAKQRRR